MKDRQDEQREVVEALREIKKRRGISSSSLVGALTETDDRVSETETAGWGWSREEKERIVVRAIFGQFRNTSASARTTLELREKRGGKLVVKISEEEAYKGGVHPLLDRGRGAEAVQVSNGGAARESEGDSQQAAR